MGTPNIPFTAYIKLYPVRTDNRWEQVRGLQKLGYLIREALVVAAKLNLAVPGGGQSANHSIWSDYVGGVAVKPQFGETPAQATVVGFWDNSDAQELLVPTTQPKRKLISGGRVWEGDAGGQPWLEPTTPTTAAQVKALRDYIREHLELGLPGGTRFEVFRLEYAGEIWGDRGQHFPR